jgi:hypothetical protein
MEIMTNAPLAALDFALAFTHAWISHDLALAAC